VATVHHFHPTLVPADAISNHVVALHELARRAGHESRVYAIESRRDLDGGVLPYRRLFRSVQPDDTLVIHYSMGNEVFDQLVKLPARKVLIYHNVTPAEFFSGINPHAALHAQLGRKQLATLASQFELAVGVSDYNRRELEAAGFARTAVVPLLIDWKAYDATPDPAVLAQWASRAVRTKILFVGRISPHKRQDDLIRLIAYHRACVDPDAQLILVGSYRDQPQYHGRLRALADELGVSQAVAFAGSVSLPALVAYYRTATAFVSLSEHEGFGVPLLEAMRFDLPVVAYDAGAVAETLGDAGLRVKSRELPEIAELVGLVAERPELRASLAAAGRRRVAEFSTERVEKRTRDVIGL
jgi:glycosyltransferase involved in cell wall biosynthesis